MGCPGRMIPMMVFQQTTRVDPWSGAAFDADSHVGSYGILLSSIHHEC
jgi:hypothetical protein